MNSNELFCHMSSKRIADLVRNAKGPICYAGPGIQLEPAKAMAEAVERIGRDQLILVLDFDERVMRMGYGDMEAVRILEKSGVVIHHSAGLRSALIIVDRKGYIFTPTPLYLEAESGNDTALNAMCLSSEQIAEALARLSPAAKAIAIAQANDPETEKRIAALPVDVASTPIGDDQFEQVERNLKEAPPVKFDLARQVHVYQPYLQYVELKLTGAAIQRNRVKIPNDMQKLGADGNLEGRLRTTFDLIDQEYELSSKSLEDDLRMIRDNFTPKVGKYGRMVLKKKKVALEKFLDKFREKLKKHQENVEEKLQKHIEKSREQVVEYYLPLVMNEKPMFVVAGSEGDEPTEDEARELLDQKLDSTFPTAESLTKRMVLEVRYKDVTFETLNDREFMGSIKKAFPDLDWEKTYKEFMAAGESEPHETKG